jgi:hypothetical protein
MKRTLFGLALITALGAGIFTLFNEKHPPAPPARLPASENPAVAGAPAPGAAWGRDELRAPSRIAAPPTKPELPKGIVLLANLRELPEPPKEVAAPAFGPP